MIDILSSWCAYKGTVVDCNMEHYLIIKLNKWRMNWLINIEILLTIIIFFLKSTYKIGFSSLQMPSVDISMYSYSYLYILLCPYISWPLLFMYYDHVYLHNCFTFIWHVHVELFYIHLSSSCPLISSSSQQFKLLIQSTLPKSNSHKSNNRISRIIA